MSVCCVLSGRGLCDELITRPEESYRLWCVVVCDLETSRTRRPWPALGRSATEKETPVYPLTMRLGGSPSHRREGGGQYNSKSCSEWFPAVQPTSSYWTVGT